MQRQKCTPRDSPPCSSIPKPTRRLYLLAYNTAPVVKQLPHYRSVWFVLTAILACRLVLGILFSLNTPLWEAYDETGHYAYARYLATHRALPPLGIKLADFDETHQPPLYYAMVALPMVFVLEDDLKPVFTAGGETWVVPAPEDRFPWRGTALSLRLGRFASLLISSLAVVFVFLALRRLLPDQERAGLIGAFSVAFWPQFVFQSGTISNDVGMVVIGAAVFWAMARLVAVPKRNLVDWILLGVMAGLATWVKANGIALLVAAVGVAAVLAARSRDVRGGLVFVASMAIVLVVGAVTSEGRSLRWSEITGAALSTPLDVGEGSGEAYSGVVRVGARAIDVLQRAIWGGFSSLFAAYSWGTLQPPQSWLWVAAGATVVSFLLGLFARGEGMRRVKALAGWTWLAVAAAPIARATFADEPSLINGRFFLPALPALAVWAALGLTSLKPDLRCSLGAALSAGLPFVALLSPWVVLKPAYQPPQPLSAEHADQRIEIPSEVVYGDALQLLGYRTLTPRAEAGGEIALEVYWRVLRPTERGYGVQLDVFNCLGESMQVRRRQTLGNNTLPTWRLPPGLVFADVYRVRLHRGDYPAQVYLALNFFDQQTNELLPWSCADQSETCRNHLSNVAVSLPWAERLSAGLRPPQARFGAGIDLLSVDLPERAQRDQPLPVRPTWRAREDVQAEYTAFVHVLNAQGDLVAQHDQPPRQGCYPSSVWRAGDVVPDTILIEQAKLERLSPGRYTVRLGLYDARTLARLPVEGDRQLRDALEFSLELE